MSSTIKFLLIWIFCITINDQTFSNALRSVHVTLPSVVIRGENAILTCYFNLDGDHLYSIKWYKGRSEFFRYTPNEIPHIRIFRTYSNQFDVDISKSNVSTVMLTSLQPNASGRYTCEVSADAPSFETAVDSAELEVVDKPSRGPRITFDDRAYRVGDILDANCEILIEAQSSQLNLTWLVNNEEWHINNQTAQPHQRQINSFTSDESDVTVGNYSILMHLKLVLQPKYFLSDNIMLGCQAKIYDIYEEFAERTVDLDYTDNQMFNGKEVEDVYKETEESDELDNITMSRGTDGLQRSYVISESNQKLPQYLLIIYSLILWKVPDILTSFWQAAVSS